MFWETKFSELQKLAPVELVQVPDGTDWIATIRAGIDHPYHKESGTFASGETRAAAICNLWAHIVKGHEPFMVFTETSAKKVRWNARWEYLEEKIDIPEVDEPDIEAFDSSD